MNFIVHTLRISVMPLPVILILTSISHICSAPTQITFPMSGFTFKEDTNYTLTAEGTELVWTYDANSDGLAEVSIGSGSSVDFSVPDNVTGEKTIKIFCRGADGEDMVAGSIGEPQASPPPVIDYPVTAEYCETNGLVIIEPESAPIVNPWLVRSGTYSLKDNKTIAGYLGNGCIHFTGNQEKSGSVNGEISYKVTIQNPGTYRLHMRAMEAPIESGKGDQANDCYVKMVGQTEGCTGKFTKFVLLGNSFQWSWNVTLECGHHNFVKADYELSAGEHIFQIAGRSKNFLIDRIVIAKTDVNAPRDHDHNPTPCSSLSTKPVRPATQLAPYFSDMQSSFTIFTLTGRAISLPHTARAARSARFRDITASEINKGSASRGVFISPESGKLIFVQ